MYQSIKRFIDIISSIILLVVLFPLLFSITTINLFFVQGNPFFLQTRFGKDLKPFSIIKFKTMVPSATKKNILGKWSHGDVEITTFGRILRLSSLDELPNLFNVFRGEMSLIGPRPLLKNHIEKYRKNNIRRHEVRPGITGLAQVKGRDGLSWSTKYGYDVFYVKNLSIKLDLYIIILTCRVLINRAGHKEDGVDPPK